MDSIVVSYTTDGKSICVNFYESIYFIIYVAVMKTYLLMKKSPFLFSVLR